jgi:hypothetical protein
MDAETGEIVAAELMTKAVDDASQLGPLARPGGRSGDLFTGMAPTTRAVSSRRPRPRPRDCDHRATALNGGTERRGRGTEPTRRDRHLQRIAEKGRIGWQKASGYSKRSRVEAAIGRYKQVIGDGPRSREDGRPTTKVGIAVHLPNRMLGLGGPISVRIAFRWERRAVRQFRRSMQHRRLEALHHHDSR